MKKIISLILAVCFIFSVVPFAISAETTATDVFETEIKAVSPTTDSSLFLCNGKKLTVRISVKQNTGINWLRLVIKYDGDAAEYVSHTSAKLFGSSEAIKVYTEKNYIIFNFFGDTSNLAVTGDLLDITFKVKAGYCGEARIYTELADDGSCLKYHSTSLNVNVPFIADELTADVHNFDYANTAVTEPTCTEQGYTANTCTVCAKSFKTDFTEPVGHNYENDEYICDNCGEIRYPDGDLNGDLTVDIIDLVRLKKILADLEANSGASSDIDGSGDTDSLDMIRLRKFLSGAATNLK